ncbi:MAG: hypothetical protein ACO34E_18870, partial [Limisphaerales bacterium]
MKSWLCVVALLGLLMPFAGRAASDVAVSSAATSGGSFSGANPLVFTPTAASAVANVLTIQQALNGGQGVTINTASGAAGNGDVNWLNPLSKTSGGTSPLVLQATRDIVISASLTASAGSMPLTLSAGGGVVISSSVSTYGGDLNITTVEPMVVGRGVDTGAGKVLVHSGKLESASGQAVVASEVWVGESAGFQWNGNVSGNLDIAGNLTAGAGTGNLSVSGSLNLQPTATTTFRPGGGTITVGGAVMVGGALELEFINGFEDAIKTGDTLTILTGGSVSGIFAGLPNDSRITLPEELGSIKIAYSATSVTLSDWQPYVRALAWDAGELDGGSSVLSNTSLRGGRHYFRVDPESTDIGAWRTALRVHQGEAQLYMKNGSPPMHEGEAQFVSDRVGSDGWVLHESQYSPGQAWYIMVMAEAGASWSIYSGRPYVEDLGPLGWNDTNGNGEYDIGEVALASGTVGSVAVGPEGMRFFRSVVPTGSPAWSLWLHGDARQLAIKKNQVPFHNGNFDRKQSGQMLVVSPYLEGSTSTYYLSVIGAPGDQVELDSHIQEVSDVGFNTTTSTAVVQDSPYRVYRVQVPVEQIAWEIRTIPGTGDPNLCVRRGNVGAEYDNDAFSEVAGSVQDSMTLVPDFLSDGTWYITVYGSAEFSFQLRNGPPTISDIQFTDTKVNDESNRAGWRFYKLSDINSQLGYLGWYLELANQYPGTEIAIRRNAVPSRWRYRSNGNPGASETYRLDRSSDAGFLQLPGHQADVYYIGVHTPENSLGAFQLDSRPLEPGTVAFDGGTSAVVDQAAQ